MRRKLFCQYCGTPLINDECSKCDRPKKVWPRFLCNAIFIIGYLLLIFVFIFVSWTNLADFQKSNQAFWGNTPSESLSSEKPIENNYFVNACLGDPKTKIYHYIGCPFIKDNKDGLVVYLDKTQAIDEGYRICDICAQKNEWDNA